MNQRDTASDGIPDDGDEGFGEADRIQENLKRRSTWLRLVFMIMFAVIYAISRVVFGAVVVFQFLWVLFTAETNRQLTELGQSLATYTYQIMRYLSFNTDVRPFPFHADWPTGAPGD